MVFLFLDESLPNENGQDKVRRDYDDGKEYDLSQEVSKSFLQFPITDAEFSGLACHDSLSFLLIISRMKQSQVL